MAENRRKSAVSTYLLLFVLALVFAAAAVLLWSVLGRFFRVGPLFPIIMVLLPLGMEGTYWMSASTRVAAAAWVPFSFTESLVAWITWER